jgi:hypothetical protein
VRQANEHNVRAGVEHGFMSTTLEYEQALKYARGSADEPSLLFVMQMGMVRMPTLRPHCSEYLPISTDKSILTPPQMFTIHSCRHICRSTAVRSSAG